MADMAMGKGPARTPSAAHIPEMVQIGRTAGMLIHAFLGLVVLSHVRIVLYSEMLRLCEASSNFLDIQNEHFQNKSYQSPSAPYSLTVGLTEHFLDCLQ